MSAHSATIAAAIVDALNAAPILGVQLQAERRYLVKAKRERLAELTTSVAVREGSLERDTRRDHRWTFTVDVGLQKAVDPFNVEEIDPLVELVEAIVDVLSPTTDANHPLADYEWEKTEFTLPLPQHLREQRVFTAVVSVTVEAVPRAD